MIQANPDAPQKPAARLELSGKPSIAVLPFTNMSGDPAHAAARSPKHQLLSIPHQRSL
jgi:TolB-like protein